MSDYLNKCIDLKSDYKLEMHNGEYVKVEMPYLCIYQVNKLFLTYLELWKQILRY